MATTVSHRLSPTQAHAIANLTGYEDADALRWQQACVQAAQQLTAERGRYAGTDTDRLAHGLDLAQRGCVTLAEDLDDLRAEVTSGNAHYIVDLAQRGCPCLDFQQRQVPCTHLLAAEIHTGALGLCTASAPLIPPDATPRVPNPSGQEAPGATASGPARARRTRTVRTPRGQTPALTGSPASWPTSEAPASMNVKLKVGNMEIMYTARDTNDQDLQDRMTRLLPWLTEVMAACEAALSSCWG
jgi:SWIM zinc finger